MLGEQTRAHEDLDLIVRVSDVPAMRDALAADGFELDRGETAFELRPARRPRAARSTSTRWPSTRTGDGIYRMENGGDWVFPAEGFSGRGRVEAREVRCLTRGRPDAVSRHGLHARRDRLPRHAPAPSPVSGPRLLPPYDERLGPGHRPAAAIAACSSIGFTSPTNG